MQLINTQLANELWLEFYNNKGQGWLTVRTGSMVPLIRPGDSVLLSPVASDKIRSGDIIVFSRNEDLIVHRVLRKISTEEGIRFIEKGDNARLWGNFSPNDVIGKVSKVKDGQKYFSLDSPCSRFASRILAAWSYMTGTIVRNFKSSRNMAVRKLGGAIRRVSFLLYVILICVCYVVWYLSGLHTGKNLV